jgi:hypothetical protein
MIIFYTIFYLIVIANILLLAKFNFLATDTVKTLLGTVTGAFLGFTGFIFQDLYTRLKKRRKDNYDSLVYVERTLIQNIESIKANILQLRKTKEIMKKSYMVMIVREIDFQTNIADNLTNIDLLNDLRLYFSTLARFRHEAKYAEEMYKTMYQHYSGDEASWSDFQKQLSTSFTSLLDLLLATLRILLDDAVQILAGVRVLLKEKRYSWFIKPEKYSTKASVMSGFEQEEIKKEIRYGDYT